MYTDSFKRLAQIYFPGYLLLSPEDIILALMLPENDYEKEEFFTYKALFVIQSWAAKFGIAKDDTARILEELVAKGKIKKDAQTHRSVYPSFCLIEDPRNHEEAS